MSIRSWGVIAWRATAVNQRSTVAGQYSMTVMFRFFQDIP